MSTKIKRIVSSLLTWFAANARDLPWRRTTDPYAVWVSEIMLQQTQVKTVLGYWERWMQALPTIGSLAKASPARIHKLWEGLGYYTRVRNMQKAARQIVSQHGGKFPQDYEAILELPGIGRYTAGAIASIAFNEPRPILDGNVMRVLARIFGVDGNVREKPVNEELWRLAQNLVTEADASFISEKVRDSSPRLLQNGQNQCSHLNQSLMELGALICTPKQPKCAICPARNYCVALRTGRIEQLPNLGKRVASTPRHFVAFVLENGGRYLVRQRPAGVVNAHLWEFPNVEIESDKGTTTVKRVPSLSPREEGAGTTMREAHVSFGRLTRGGWEAIEPERGGQPNIQRRLTSAATELGLKPAGLEYLCTIKHTITRYRITLEAYRGEVTDMQTGFVGDGRWLKPIELRKLAFTSAHRRVLERLK